MSDRKRAKSSHPQVSRLSISEGPKTSEYAFFKKLRKDAIGTKSRLLCKEKLRSKILEVNPQNRDPHTYSSIHESSSRSQNQEQSNKLAFRSPPRVRSSNLWAQKGKSSGINQTSYGDVVSFDQSLLNSPFAGAGNNIEEQTAEEEVFAIKRQRLRQLATDLFPEAGKCSSKGFDLVSALIGRLLPRSNETELDTQEKTYGRKGSKMQDRSSCFDVSPRYKFGRQRDTVLSKSRDNETECSNSEGRIIGVEHSSYDFLKLLSTERTSQNVPGDYAFPNYLSKKKVLSNWDMSSSDLPCIKYYSESDFQDEETNYNCQTNDGTIQYTFPESDSSFCFRSNRHSGTDHIKQLYDLDSSKLDGSPNEGEIREAHTLFLSLDVKDDKKEDLYSTLEDPLNFASQQVMDDNIENVIPCLSSLYPNHYLDFFLRPYIHSTCTYFDNMGGNHQDNSAVPSVDLFPLSLSLPAKPLTMGEDWDIFSCFDNSKINLPQQDPPWCTSKADGMKSDFGALLLSRGFDSDLVWRSLPKSDFLEYYSSDSLILQFPFKEDVCSYATEPDEEIVLHSSPRGKRILASYDDAFSILDWSSPSLELTLGERMNYPLLLDYPDWGRTAEVTYSDNETSLEI